MLSAPIQQEETGHPPDGSGPSVFQEPQMDGLRQRSRKFWHSLIAWAGRSASAREMGQRLQRSKHIMDCMHKRQRPATVEDSLAVVAAIGVPDWLAFQRLFPQPEDPAEAGREIRCRPSTRTRQRTIRLRHATRRFRCRFRQAAKSLA